MQKKALSFLESLSNGFGPSGFERDIIRLVKNYVEPYSDSIEQDKLGSLLFYKKGTSERPVILLPGHVDQSKWISHIQSCRWMVRSGIIRSTSVDTDA